ncbi:MAG: heme transporter [Gordonia sp. (in: high G+C Gram-positive bacteria)]
MPTPAEEPENTHGAQIRPQCGREHECACARSRAGNDLETLLADPGFRGTLLGEDVVSLGAHLPLLDQVVGVTVAGPVIVNDVGVHEIPVLTGGPIRCDPSRITLRLNPARLGSALITEPQAHIPPTLRLFDADGNTAHATYLTEFSDRLAFEAIALAAGRTAAAPPETPRPQPTTCTGSALEDQITQLDDVLSDGGIRRLASMPAHAAKGFTRVESRQVIATLEYAALHNLSVTVTAAAPGCLQMRHDRLDAAREHRGQVILASGGSRVMINFNLVTECWVTWSQGVWGPTGSIEIYDRHAQCSMVITQTGAVEPAMFYAWQRLLENLTA